MLTAHQPSEESPIPNLGSGFNSGLYINYDTSTLDVDGIFEFQANLSLKYLPKYKIPSKFNIKNFNEIVSNRFKKIRKNNQNNEKNNSN